jgi:transglutaminase-like putative cysteine protease
MLRSSFVMNALERFSMNRLNTFLRAAVAARPAHRVAAVMASLARRYFTGKTNPVNPLGYYLVLRPTALVTAFAMLSLVTSPAVQALQSPAPAPRKVVAQDALAAYNRQLEELRGSLQQSDANTIARMTTQLRRFAPAVVAELERNKAAMREGRTELDASTFFETRHAQLMGQLGYALQAPTAEQPRAFAAADVLLKDVGRGMRANAKDYNKLAWRVEPGDIRKPAEDSASLAAWLNSPAPAAPASVDAAAPQTKRLQAQRLEAATTESGTKTAQGAPQAADLAATVDAPLTDAIRAKALALHKNPVEIYTWVRNNIAYFPSYGSAQGAQMTLDKRQGNAFDTASLLIALLRAAGISARYVYGTVDLPAEQVMNWVGNAKTVDAAQQILGQGGIPNTALVKGGKISTIRLEHVWVEAFVSYFPSRGAKHIGGQSQGDTWVPLDASFKQYQYAAGMDLAAIAPFDASTFLTQAQQGATVNEAEGWVQNLNQANVQQALTAYQTKLADAIKARKPDATVGDVLGKTIIPEKTYPYLYGSLPYKTQAIGARYSELPARLRHRFHYSMYADAYSRNIESAVFDYQGDLPSLAGKKVTLAFVPANPAAAKAIEAMLPKPHADGSPIQPSELPTAFSHRIQVKAQLRVDGQTVAEGGSFGMGTELAGRGGFTTRDLSDLDLTDDDTLIAGQQSALGISVFGISAQQLKTLQARMQETKDKLEAYQKTPSAALLDGIDGERLTGDILTANAWSYFASLQSHGQIASRQAGVIDNPGLSYGFFHVAGKPNKLWGMVTTGFTVNGIMADIGHLRHLRWVQDDSPTSPINQPPSGSTLKAQDIAKSRWVSYNRMRGQYASAMEHATPEQFFVDKTQCGNANQPACQQAISAVKALQIAAAEGQKIYTITQANFSSALPKISLSSAAREEIRNAVAAGKEVTIHERPIHAFGWSGSGYTVIDPETGAGAYMIDGGANGAIYIAVGVIFIMCALAPLFMTGGLAAVGLNFLASFFALGLGYILMGAGLILDNQALVITGAATATGGVIAIASVIGVVSALFVTLAGKIALPLVTALGAIIKALASK